MEFVKDSYEHVTSPAAKRTYLRTFLVLAASLVLLGFAAVAYPIFYYNYVPKKVISIPVHLQYNAGLNPYGIAHLSSHLSTEQAYDVTVELILPRSPANLERGNFMVALYALKSQPENPALAFGLPPASSLADPYEHVTPGSVVFSSRRPALLPYRDPLVSRAARLLFLPYHVLFPAAEATASLVVPMGEMVEFERGDRARRAQRQPLPLSVLLDVQAGQGLQVYSASVTLVARLSGLRWAMYNHRILSFVAGTTAFWFAEMLSMGGAWLIVAQCVSGGSGGRRQRKFTGGRDRSGGMLRGDIAGISSGNPSRLPSLAGVKHEDDELDDEEEEDVKVKVEEEDMEQEIPATGDILRQGGDADDEEDGDEEDAWKESKSGTSGFRRDGKGGSIRRRSSRGGGVTASS